MFVDYSKAFDTVDSIVYGSNCYPSAFMVRCFTLYSLYINQFSVVLK